MQVKQISDILNDIITTSSLGLEPIQEEDLDGIVSTAKDINSALGLDNYVRALVNHIGKVVFVNRVYKAKAPNVLMDGWKFGSILEKIDCDMPDSQENQSWDLNDNQTYDQDTFKGAKNVRARFFNDKTSYEIQISIAEMQVEESFSSLQQLNGFFSMVFTKINNSIELNNKNLIMRTINNFTAAKLYHEFSDLHSNETGLFNFGNNSKVSAINLLGLYKEENPDNLTTEELTSITPSNCIKNLQFLKFCTMIMSITSDRMEDISTLFNIGNRQRFTPKDRQHFVLLSEFARAADTYLQSDTFHNEFVKLPKHETVVYWQGSGTDYSFSSTSKISVINKGYIDKDGEIKTDSIKVELSGVLGVMFDEDALGVNNYNQRVPSHYNAKGEFVNYFYKTDARYFNDYDENFIVFFVA